MSTLKEAGRVVGSGGTDMPPYQVDLRVSRHTFVADEPRIEGGANAGPNPFEYVLCGLVACTATTLRMYAERKAWDLSTITVDVRLKLDESGHASIERTILVPRDLTSDQQARLEEISARTPVTQALRIPIATSVIPGDV
jgi:putative redox protein